MSQSPRNRPPVRRVVPGQEAGGQAPPPRSGARQPQPQRPRQQTNVNAPRRSDPFPLVIGGIFVVLVVGLLVLVFLFSMNRGNNGPVASAGQPTTIGASDNSNSGVNAVPTQAPGADQTQAAAPTVEPAPRMPLDQFLALYDDPAKRPLIIDVRAKESYDQGHIAGAISFPESDVDTRINELPKDKLIVAYCQ